MVICTPGLTSSLFSERPVNFAAFKMKTTGSKRQLKGKEQNIKNVENDWLYSKSCTAFESSKWTFRTEYKPIVLHFWFT